MDRLLLYLKPQGKGRGHNTQAFGHRLYHSRFMVNRIGQGLFYQLSLRTNIVEKLLSHLFSHTNYLYLLYYKILILIDYIQYICNTTCTSIISSIYASTIIFQ